MDISSAAAAYSALSLSNVQAEAAMRTLKKTLDLQQAAALQLLEALPEVPAVDPSATVGVSIDTWA